MVVYSDHALFDFVERIEKKKMFGMFSHKWKSLEGANKHVHLANEAVSRNTWL